MCFAKPNLNVEPRPSERRLTEGALPAFIIRNYSPTHSLLTEMTSFYTGFRNHFVIGVLSALNA